MPTDQNSLNIVLSNGDKDKLKKTYAEVIGTIMSTALSVKIKNNDVIGNVVEGGTVEVRRFATSLVKNYGTARTNGKGDALKNIPVKVVIDKDKEIVEELQYKDIQMYGVPNLIEKRKVNHVAAMQADLDKAYFLELVRAAQTISVTGSDVYDKVMNLIQQAEKTVNDNVDGIDRNLFILTLAPAWYDALKKFMIAQPSPDNGGNIQTFNGIEVWAAPRQSVDAVLQVRGAVAQPVAVAPYYVEKINLSNATAVELFYHYGTAAITPDLIWKAAMDSNISA